MTLPNPEDLSRLPMPPPDERFVRNVMSRIAEPDAFDWRSFWRVPALGFALAAALFAFLTILPSRAPDESVYESVLSAETGDDDLLELAVNAEDDL